MCVRMTRIPPTLRAMTAFARLAEDPTTAPAALRALTLVEPSMLALVAGNPACPPDLLAEAGTSADIEVRRAVAVNTGAPAHVLAMLAQDDVVSVRAAVLTNPACPDELAVMLALAGVRPGATRLR